MKKRLAAMFMALSIIATGTAGYGVISATSVTAQAAQTVKKYGGMTFTIPDGYTHTTSNGLDIYYKEGRAIVVREIESAGLTLDSTTAKALYEQNSANLAETGYTVNQESDIQELDGGGVNAFMKMYDITSSGQNAKAAIVYLQKGDGNIVYLYIAGSSVDDITGIAQEIGISTGNTDNGSGNGNSGSSDKDNSGRSNTGTKKKAAKKKIKYGSQKQLYKFCRSHKGYMKSDISAFNAKNNKGVKYYKIRVKSVSRYIDGVYSVTATDGHHYKYSLSIGGEERAPRPKKGQTLKVALEMVHVKDMFEENDWGIADIVPASHVKK